MDLITGNRFLEMSDMIYDVAQDNFKLLKDICVSDKPPFVICETHNLNRFFEMLSNKQDCLPDYLKKIILISHNSDGCIVSYKWRPFDFQYVERNIPANIVAWYAQNLDVLSSRIRPLPIGLENFAWHKGRKWQELTAVAMQKIPRNKMLYMNFELSTNPEERNACFNELRTKRFVTNGMKKVSYLEYITEMKRHYFVACPEGNGFDTHRMWEALYLGCIPIVRNRVFTQMFSKLFPMVIIDNWNDVIDRLKFIGNESSYNRFIDFYKKKSALNFSFWEKVVRGIVKIS